MLGNIIDSDNTMPNAHSNLLPLTHPAILLAEEITRVPGSFGAIYFSFYFSFNKSLPAGQSSM